MPYQNSKTYKLALSAMLAALAIIFSYVEFLIPYNLGIPGVKLGLPNLVILLALYRMSDSYAITINLIRILVAGLLFTGLFGTFYSLAGGILSIIVMIILKRTGIFSIIGVSMAGGVAHNIGQLLMASFLVSNLKMFIYFPILLFTGIGAGIALGVVTNIIEEKIPERLF